MKIFGLFLMLFFFGLPRQVPEDEILIQQESVLWRRITLPGSTFDVNEIEKRFRSILAERDRGLKVLVVEVLDHPNSVILSRMGITDLNYELWRTLYGDYEKRIPPFAELVMMNENAAMRVRDHKGRIMVKTLQGEDPFVFRVDGREFMMVHLAINRAGIPSDLSGRYVNLSLFLITREGFGEADAMAALDHLRTATSMVNVDVIVRTDPWFITHSDYPVVSPFMEVNRPPTKEQHNRSAEWSCVSYASRRNCWGTSR